MLQPVSIVSIASVSPLGHQQKTVLDSYSKPETCFTERRFAKGKALVAPLHSEAASIIKNLRKSDQKYRFLDDSVLMAIAAARDAVSKAGWVTDQTFGVNIGSSRGATSLFEKHHLDFIQTGKLSALTSPTTTLGNLSSWVAHDLQSSGPVISHSITCSTALHALLNGIVWLQSGMADKFLVGGSEAPLTEFTVAQMQAMKIYATKNETYPCRGLDLSKKQNSMILGEGAAVCCLESGRKENALAFVEGIGYATELLEHNTSISADAICFQKSMKMALGQTAISEVDVIVMHAPGTVKGDSSEYEAIRKVFDEQMPLLTTNKWKIGHTLGASGMLSIEMALLMLQHQRFFSVPFVGIEGKNTPIKKVLVNAVGFGGNAVSVLLSL